VYGRTPDHHRRCPRTRGSGPNGHSHRPPDGEAEEATPAKVSKRGVFPWFEQRGLLPVTPAFHNDYPATFPKLKLLEDQWQDVHDECLELLTLDNKLKDISKLGGAYTQDGIHVIQWKTFMLKSENSSNATANARRRPSHS
jgi:hypothetical protein